MRRIALYALPLLALTAAKAAPEPALFLTPEKFDPAKLLPPPAAEGTPEARAELAFLQAEDKVRTTAEATEAAAEGKLKSTAVFAGVLGPRFDPATLPVTTALFATLRQEEKAAVARAKTHFLRNRPWIVDPKLHSCAPDDEPKTSYPSGHVSMAYSTAALLARLMPDKAPQLLDRARTYSQSRIVCEQHFPGDIAAGEAYGLLITERLMETPAFVARFDAAAAELRSKGL
ncbi:phosphatase PAP2 family protein [Sphingomonas nostoxanthinifaciens]|uniref:phosphatase PAP2 family protein n=1 Tax=Sphingomonas nostoxanthinifaciens TaxID=2872652 RepID=UPI001CC1E02A|nr:phosphatase PAP2 family protein [Sphingomonas nostoxanthinifaciens]UAK23207.1 phosphatase PAP2 family protein [Sphingomonas nostoxanthinifaciens]